mmetsp:Transcript_36036/g.41616  ORF Transcript_36036/g.41616 Transcript_36036/m.41616 type:complete len:167 (+) Transcript_36036:133-633(+)
MPKCIRRNDDCALSNMSTLPQTLSSERQMEEQIRTRTKKIISDANLTFDQSRLLQQKIKVLLKKFNSNKVGDLKRTYGARRRIRMKAGNFWAGKQPDFRVNEKPRLFSPEVKIRGMFSPQPWRVFSPVDRKVIKNKKKTTHDSVKRKEIIDQFRHIKNCRNLIYDK